VVKMANGKNGKKKKDVDFLEGMNFKFSDSSGTGKKGMGYGDMGMPDINLKMDLGLDNLKGSGKGSKMDMGLGNLKGSGSKKDPLLNLKSSKNDFGDFNFGKSSMIPKRKKGKGSPLVTDKDLQRAKKGVQKLKNRFNDPRTKIEKKLGLPKDYREKLQEARESGEINGRSDTEKAVAGVQAIKDKEDYEKLKEQRKQARRNTPVRRGLRKIHQKLKDYGEEKPTAKPTPTPKPTPKKKMYVLSVMKNGVAQNRYANTLAEALQLKGSLIGSGYQYAGMRVISA
tara:strand:+ start:744 stop:1595 length:852 start_codon:yes stop_codon:yes gene_type:complete